MANMSLQLQLCNNSICARARAALGVNTRASAAEANVGQRNLRGLKQGAHRYRDRACDYAERALRAARWGQA